MCHLSVSFFLRFDSRHLILNGAIHFFILFLTVLHSMWDLGSPTRDQTCTPCSGSAESVGSATGPIWKVPGDVFLVGVHWYSFWKTWMYISQQDWCLLIQRQEVFDCWCDVCCISTQTWHSVSTFLSIISLPDASFAFHVASPVIRSKYWT